MSEGTFVIEPLLQDKTGVYGDYSLKLEEFAENLNLKNSESNNFHNRQKRRTSFLTPNLKPHLIYRIQQNIDLENRIFFPNEPLKNRSQFSLDYSNQLPPTTITAINSSSLDINNNISIQLEQSDSFNFKTADFISEPISFIFNNTSNGSSDFAYQAWTDYKLDDSSKLFCFYLSLFIFNFLLEYYFCNFLIFKNLLLI